MGGAPPHPITNQAASKRPRRQRDWEDRSAREWGARRLPGVRPRIPYEGECTFPHFVGEETDSERLRGFFPVTMLISGRPGVTARDV